MKKAVTIAQKKDGEWITLAHPDVPIHEQKIAFKKLKAEGSDVYIEAIILFTPGKRHKFDYPKKKLALSDVDDLTGKAEEDLQAVIKAEGLKVKFNKDHEKTRAAIRKARAEGTEKPKKPKKPKKAKKTTPEEVDGVKNETPRDVEKTKEPGKEK